MGLFGSRKTGAGSPAAGREVKLSDGSLHTLGNSIDCLGDSCPRPQLMTKKALGKAAPNEVIEVRVDNPTSMEALPPMCPALGATHLETVQQAGGWHVYIRKD